MVSRSVDILVRYIQYHAMATLYGEESGSSFLSTGWHTGMIWDDFYLYNVSSILLTPAISFGKIVHAKPYSQHEFAQEMYTVMTFCEIFQLHGISLSHWYWSNDFGQKYVCNEYKNAWPNWRHQRKSVEPLVSLIPIKAIQQFFNIWKVRRGCSVPSFFKGWHYSSTKVCDGVPEIVPYSF